MRIFLVAVLMSVQILSGAQAQKSGPVCPGAPLTRLAVGESGTVAPGVDRLRLRALPAVGAGEVRLLYSGTAFEVLTGPSCNGGYSWWRIKTEDGAAGWAAEGTWEQYYLRPVYAEPRSLCQRAETPLAQLLLAIPCALLGG